MCSHNSRASRLDTCPCAPHTSQNHDHERHVIRALGHHVARRFSLVDSPLHTGRPPVRRQGQSPSRRLPHTPHRPAPELVDVFRAGDARGVHVAQSLGSAGNLRARHPFRVRRRLRTSVWPGSRTLERSPRLAAQRHHAARSPQACDSQTATTPARRTPGPSAPPAANAQRCRRFV